MKRLKYFMRKFRYNRKRKSLAGVLVLLCLSLTLGFAYLTTELNINGTLNIASSRWDIHFENIEISPDSVTATTDPTISNDTTITFATTLEKPGDFYEFTTDIVNDGTYDAKIDSIALSPTLTSEEEEFFEYKIEYTDGGNVQVDDALDAGTSENIRVLFKYKENNDSSKYPEEDTDFTVEVTITYVQGTGNPVQHTSLYSVLKTAAKDGTYAKEYTGSHQDSMVGVGSKKIYHWYAPRLNSGNTLANTIADMNNVIFAGYCWKMIRTTDTGGVKMMYNGVPNNGQCTSSTVTIGSDYYTPSVNRASVYPGYNPDLLGSFSSVGYMNNGNYLYTNYTYTNHTTILPYSELYLTLGNVISYGPTADPADTDPDELSLNVNYAGESLTGEYIYNINGDDCLFYIVYQDSYDESEYILYGLDLSNNSNTINPDTEIIIGTSYTKSGNTYTLQNTESVTLLDWPEYYYQYEGFYTCEDDEIQGSRYTCSNVNYITSPSISSYSYNSSEDEYLYASGFTYDSGTNKYTLNSDRISYWAGSATVSTSQLNTHHYTCLDNTYNCTYLAYIQDIEIDNQNKNHFVLLKNGESIETVLENTLTANNLNTYDSPIKAAIDTWFSTNTANTNYASQLEDVIFCNNRDVASLGTYNPSGGVLGTDLTFRNYIDYYSNNRTALDDLSCPNARDRFSVSNSQAQLTYPVALVTAPEIDIDGNRNIFGSNSGYWTMTPYYLTSYGGYTMYSVGGNPVQSKNTDRYYGYSGGVRPVISLKPRTLYASGNGSKNNPYVIG